MTYSVFIGLLDESDKPEITNFQSVPLPWDEARRIMFEKLRGFEIDDCVQCWSDAMRTINRLSDAQPGRFEAEVDGEDYVIFENP